MRLNGDIYSFSVFFTVLLVGKAHGSPVRRQDYLRGFLASDSKFHHDQYHSADGEDGELVRATEKSTVDV